jgi:hypothetical protein
MRASHFYKKLGKLKLLFMSRPQKVLFEHIPKCGGATVTHYLKSQCVDNKIFSIRGDTRKSINNFKSLPEEKRYSYDLVLGHGAHKLIKYAHPEVLKATILREPVERIISHYYYVLRTPKHYLYEEVIEKGMSLVDYATSGISRELRNNYVCRFLQISANEVEANAEESIMRAYDILKEEYRVVGILEDLNTAMIKLAQLASFHSKFEPVKLNVTMNRPKLVDIDQETLNIISETNTLDIRLFALIKENFVKGPVPLI